MEALRNMDEHARDSILLISAGVFHCLLGLYQVHSSLQARMVRRSFNDQLMWANDFPIVLVHGYCGSTMDENIFMGGYFHYGFSPLSRKYTDKN